MAPTTQPCVLPGDLAERHRAHGDFMWRQFYNMIRVGAQGIYISMFGEFNEGNQIAKTDYYLRLTADGGRMLKRQLPPPTSPCHFTATRPTRPIP